MKILIVNLHSALNLGDDAIMHATLAGLRRWQPEAEISLAANDPDSWKKFPGVRTLGSFAHWVYRPSRGGWQSRRWLLPLMLLGLPLIAGLFRAFRVRCLAVDPAKSQLLAAYYDADLVLSCGGGNFYAHKSVSPFLFLALLALVYPTWLGKPVYLLPQSIGPINGRLQRWLAGYAFSRVNGILTREQRSTAFLRDVLHVRTSIEDLPDLAFDLPSPPRASVPTLGSLHVGVSVIDRGRQDRAFSHQARYEGALVALAQHLANRYDSRLSIFCQVYGPTADQDDRNAAQRLAVALSKRGISVNIKDTYTDAHEVIEACGDVQLMIATRMHAAIFALLSGAPTIAIAYQPKTFGVMAGLGLEDWCLAIEQVTDARLIELADAALCADQALRERIDQGVEAFRGQLAGWPSRLAE